MDGEKENWIVTRILATGSGLHCKARPWPHPGTSNDWAGRQKTRQLKCAASKYAPTLTTYLATMHFLIGQILMGLNLIISLFCV